MEIYDIIMLVVLAGAMLFGAIKGFAWQMASIASIVVSYFVAYRFREPFSESIQAEPPWNQFLAMLILFVGTSLVIWVLFRMVSGTIDRLKLREFDRQIGALFGLAKGALYCILITLFAVTLMGDRVRETIVSSRSGHYIAKVLDRSQAVIPPEIHDVVQPYLDRFDERFNESSENGLFDRIPWLAGGQPDDRLPRETGAQLPPRTVSGNTQATGSWQHQPATIIRPTGAPTRQPQPSFAPATQQAQQPSWYNRQR